MRYNKSMASTSRANMKSKSSNASTSREKISLVQSPRESEKDWITRMRSYGMTIAQIESFMEVRSAAAFKIFFLPD